MPLYIEQSGDLDRYFRCLTDGQTLKDRAAQLFIKYKSGVLVTQFFCIVKTIFSPAQMHQNLKSKHTSWSTAYSIPGKEQVGQGAGAWIGTTVHCTSANTSASVKNS